MRDYLPFSHPVSLWCQTIWTQQDKVCVRSLCLQLRITETISHNNKKRDDSQSLTKKHKMSCVRRGFLLWGDNERKNDCVPFNAESEWCNWNMENITVPVTLVICLPIGMKRKRASSSCTGGEEAHNWNWLMKNRDWSGNYRCTAASRWRPFFFT